MAEMAMYGLYCGTWVMLIPVVKVGPVTCKMGLLGIHQVAAIPHNLFITHFDEITF